MTDILIRLSEIFLLVLALSLDSFTACFAYGSNKILIPFKSVLIISCICSISLGISLFLGNFITSFFSLNLNLFSFIILFILGFFKLFDYIFKSIIKHLNGFSKKLSFSFLNLKFILSIYANPQNADIDKSKSISSVEAASLAFALSLDSITVGLGYCCNILYSCIAVIISFIINIIIIKSAAFLGNKTSSAISLDFSFICGIILITLAFLKLI